MKELFETVYQNPLWSGISFQEFETMFPCVNGTVKGFAKGEVILFTGDPVKHIGIVLSGSIKIIREDENGNVSILTELSRGDLFGETFASAGVLHSPVSVVASVKSEVLFFDFQKIISTCTSACRFHAKMIENMLHLVAQKNLLLNQKIEILSKRTTREKILSFFDSQREGAKQFTIPFNREEMANYICVDRSAMSNELSKMRNEGLLRFNKNQFELLH